MDHFTSRDRAVSISFYAITALATLLWWGFIFFYPESKMYFFGTEFSNKFFRIFLGGDALSAFVLVVVQIPLLAKSNPLAKSISWVHFGAQGYAFCSAIALAIFDPLAYWGVVCMLASSSAALFIALRLNNIPILWGPFQFKPAKSQGFKENWKSTLLQTLFMWITFLAFFPLVIVLIEHSFSWQKNWFTIPFQVPLSIILFVIFGSIGIWAGFAMVSIGRGTPLPSAHTANLVVCGPYQYVRNPMAVMGIGQGIAVGFAIGSPIIICYSIIGGIAWEILVRPLEENDLEQRFGELYRTYGAHVKCWVPTFKPFAFPDKLQG